MKSRYCNGCSEFWPRHHFHCPVCKTPTQESSREPMEEHEYKLLLYAKKGRFPDVPKSEQEQVDSEWEALESEAERRGPNWSVADLIADGFRPVPPVV